MQKVSDKDAMARVKTRGQKARRNETGRKNASQECPNNKSESVKFPKLLILIINGNASLNRQAELCSKRSTNIAVANPQTLL